MSYSLEHVYRKQNNKTKQKYSLTRPIMVGRFLILIKTKNKYNLPFTEAYTYHILNCEDKGYLLHVGKLLGALLVTY